ncbi:unnamed protein product [Parascedosporium putredinis]|uniref:Uncharacterized protein n=1 Tax=Parascedosporium putredinis TaxID=1442378 RepID=A0A9P1H1V4_9PEZI|nr:unnamed protein product [Parascedosporium putredinis]CAI7994138.1 unnamed protein product [Parascedosporium putredinis]
METSSLNLNSTPAGTSEGPSTSQRNGAFPEKFTIYRHAKLSRTYILGDGPDSPIYALSYQGSDTSGQPQIILHSGPQSDTTLSPHSGAAIASLGVEKSGWKLVRLGAGGKGDSKTDASVVASGGDASIADNSGAGRTS